ncbi:MAG: FixH family protein [Gemmobacter sp.]
MANGKADGKPREITGRHVAAIFVTAFGIIIGVNLFMASKAIGTFPGIEVKSPYVASQSFDADRRAQEALGWQVQPTYDRSRGELVLKFTAGDGARPAEVAALRVLVGRATQATSDQTPEFVREGTVFVAPLTLAPGKWLVRIEAEAADGTAFRQRHELFVRG